MDYLYVGSYILKERERLGLSSCDPYEVGFKVVKPWAEMVSNWDNPDYRVTSHEGLYGAYSICTWSLWDNQHKSVYRKLVEGLRTKAAKRYERKLRRHDGHKNMREACA
jgi:hypothetical protein